MYREELTPAERTLQAEIDALKITQPAKRPEGFDYPPSVPASQVIAHEVQATMSRRTAKPITPWRALVSSGIVGVALALAVMSVAAATVILFTRHL